MVDMKKIFSDYIDSEKKEVRFAVVKFKSCNGNQRQSFTQAECKFDILKGNDKKSCWVTFDQMFKNGICFINDIIGGVDTTDSKKRDALKRVETYYQSKEKNEKSLTKVFGKKTVTETDVTVALTEHLLMALSPGQSCLVDTQSKSKNPCKCGCKKNATFGDTIIGNTSVWHGRIDVIFSSPKQDVADGMENLNLNSDEDSENVEEEKTDEDSDNVEEEPTDEDRENVEEETDEDSENVEEETTDEDSENVEEEKTDEDSENVEEEKTDEDSHNVEVETTDKRPVGESIAEVKKAFAYHSMNQALAQTIVFSCLKKQKTLGCTNHMVPNIVISKKKFKIIMYDAEKDVFLYSRSISLFDSQRKLSSIAIIVIWMVLHYRLFCSGFSGVNEDMIKRCKSGFPERVGDKWSTYSNDLEYVESGYKKYAKIDKLLEEGKQLNLLDE